MTEPLDLLDYLGASKKLGIKINTLYSLVSQRRIPHVRLGGGRIVRFRPEDLDQWVKDRTHNPEEEQP